MAPQPPQVHFARQAVIDGSVEPMGLELVFRWKEGQRRPPRPPSPCATSLLLSRALLDGGLIQQRRPGCLFVDMDAAALLHWAAGTDWQLALLRGWRDVLLQSPEPAWCEALLANWPDQLLRDDPATVLALLPLPAREQHWQRQLHADPAALQALARQVLAACPAGETLSLPLSTALAAALRWQIGSPPRTIRSRRAWP